MKITANIVDPFNTEIIIKENIDLFDIPTAGNYTIIDNEIYRIGHTLFRKWGNSYYYEFEQKIKKSQYGIESPPPYLLLLGKIKFEDFETNFFFKDVTVKQKNDDGYNLINVKIKAPYNYMRIYDLIEIDNQFLVCSDITVVENIEIKVDFFMSPISLKNFHEDSNHFLRNI